MAGIIIRIAARSSLFGFTMDSPSVSLGVAGLRLAGTLLWIVRAGLLDEYQRLNAYSKDIMGSLSRYSDKPIECLLFLI
jgi:hypothetical protein